MKQSAIGRREFLGGAVAGALACAVPGVIARAQGVPAMSPRRPNVLFIAADDLKPLLGCYGSERIHTPHMDRLAARGTVFRNNHCQQAVCGPSRASLMTGLRPDTTRVWDLKTRMRDVNPDLVTLPQHFRANGYETAAMGKIHDPRCAEGWGREDGPSWSVPFIKPTVWADVDSAGGYADPATVALRRKVRAEGGDPDAASGADRSPANTKPSTECVDVPDDAYFDGALASEAVRWLGKLSAGDKPFFLAVGFHKPHLPFVAPKRYWDLYDRDATELHPVAEMPEGAPEFAYQNSWELRAGYTDAPKDGPIPPEMQRELIHGYRACVSYVDAQVGRLLDELERLGIADDTIVVLWGDHGWHLGDHGMWCKHTNYEQATRSPLIIADPRLPRGQTADVTDAPTEFVDIYPTLSDLTGLEAPAQLEGVSLVPLITRAAERVKAAAISQYPRNPGGDPAMGYALRSPRYRYVAWVQKDFYAGEADGPIIARELYDYATDPMETTNLADDAAHAKTVAIFDGLYAGGWPAIRDARPEGL